MSAAEIKFSFFSRVCAWPLKPVTHSQSSTARLTDVDAVVIGVCQSREDTGYTLSVNQHLRVLLSWFHNGH